MSTDALFQFPHPSKSNKHGLLHVGGELTPEGILQAYSQGIFPWFQPGNPVLWWSPNPRLILYPEDFKVSRSLQAALKKEHRFTMDTYFEEVIKACATVNDREGNTWITKEMIEAYTTLHHQGYAHSFEIWHGDKLTGGLYGLSLGKAFFGESMFHRETNASKMAMFYLCQTMKQWDFEFIDCQLPTAHLKSLGGKMISRDEFLYKLQNTLKNTTKIGIWQL